MVIGGLRLDKKPDNGYHKGKEAKEFLEDNLLSVSLTITSHTIKCLRLTEYFNLSG